MVRRLLGSFWFYYCFTALALWFILAYPLLMILVSKQHWHGKAYKLRSWLSFWFLKLNGIRVDVEDQRPSINSGPVILCSNHSSELDIIVLLSIFKGPYAFLGKQPLAKLPLFGQFFRALDIGVDRQNAFKAYGSYKAALERLSEGYNVVIFPEGGIAGDPAKLQPFKKGAFLLAANSQVAIQPVAIQNSWRILHPFQKRGSMGTIKVVIMPVVKPGTSQPADLKEAVSKQINRGLNV
jgi:1-acyl-sn-glycerol-3-phosphate acyltransferase